jgi:hypothetical protein
MKRIDGRDSAPAVFSFLSNMLSTGYDNSNIGPPGAEGKNLGTNKQEGAAKSVHSFACVPLPSTSLDDINLLKTQEIPLFLLLEPKMRCATPDTSSVGCWVIGSA